jgi:histidine ammonia-lyase
VLAIELVCAAQAADLRADVASPGPATSAVLRRLREQIPFMDVDREVASQLATAEAMLPELVSVAESVTGPLG